MENFFFDRKDTLEILDKRIKGFKEGFRQNIAIIGDELLGKSYLVKNFLSTLRDESILVVYIELRPESFQSFIRRSLSSILYNLLKDYNLRLREELDYLIEKSTKFFPKISLKVKEILVASEKKKNLEAFLSLLSLSKLIKEEANKLFLIVLDEFVLFEDFDIKNLFKEWAKIIITEKNTMYILVSSSKTKAKSILSSELSLLFGNFEIIEILPFGQNLSYEFIEKMIFPLELDRRILEYLINFTGGIPFYLELICRDFLNKARRQNQREISQDLFLEVLADLLFDQKGILNQRFLGILKSLNQEPLSLLVSIASGHNRIKDIASHLHLHKKNVSLKLNKLQEKDLVERSGDFYKICDRVFSFWLRFVYLIRSGPLELDESRIRDEFRRRVSDSIAEFINTNKKERLLQIIELFSQFCDDKISIEKKRLKLDRFREIKPLRLCGEKEGILGRTRENLWIAMLKEDLVTEDDISKFVHECKKFRSERLQKKLIITFSEMDINAKLLSKEQKIETWDTQILNLISDLYNRPRIIIPKG